MLHSHVDSSARRIDISFIRPEPVAVGDTLKVIFRVHNDTPDELPGQRLELVGGAYFRPTSSVAVPRVAPYSESKHLCLVMRCYSTTDPALVPRTFKVRLTASEIECTCRLRFWTFTQALRDYTPAGLPGAIGADKYNLLCFGVAGSGKSSFQNGVMTLMHEGQPSHCANSLQ